jgi:hypothetical protein
VLGLCWNRRNSIDKLKMVESFFLINPLSFKNAVQAGGVLTTFIWDGDDYLGEY